MSDWYAASPLERARLGVVEAADGEPEVAVHVPHPLRVAAGEVRVHRHEMRAAARQRIQVQRQRRDERLSLAGRHLGDPAEVELDAAHELDVVRHHVPLEVAARDARPWCPGAGVRPRGPSRTPPAGSRRGSRRSSAAARPRRRREPSAPLSSLSSCSRSAASVAVALLLLQLRDAGLERGGALARAVRGTSPSGLGAPPPRPRRAAPRAS